MSDELAGYEVDLTESALEDIRNIKGYIANDLGSPIAAQRAVAGILDAAYGLKVMPLRNRVLVVTQSGSEIRRARVR